MRVAAFHGVRYASDVVGDLARVTAPPYDAIDTVQQRALHEASAHNVVRLELGLDLDSDDDDANRYSRAAGQYHAWWRDGVLVPDAPTARMHVYEQTFTDPDDTPRRQVGLLAALGLSPWEAGEVLPHERTFRGPVEDRLRLLRALPVNVSPVFVVYPGRTAAVTEAIATATASAPTHDFRCEDGVRHRTWPVGDAATLASVTAALADRVGLMADGHHRYTTALEYRAETTAPGGGAILAFLVSEEEGPTVRATHRLVRRLPLRWREVLEAAGAEVTRSWEGPRPDLALHELAHDRPAFGLVTRHRTEVLRGPDLRRVLPLDTPPSIASLDVTVLQTLLLDHLGVPDRIEDLRYTADVEEGVASVGRGEHEALFLVNPVTLAEVRAAAEAGVRLPPKSTSFHPKPRTGLLLRPLAPELGS